jgi:hypothetical protein
VSKTIALIACSNGLGHIRRLIILSQALIKNGAKPTIFAPEKSVTRLVQLMDIKQPPEVFNFDSHTTVDDWLEERAFTWYENLPNLSNYDQVVSDNLVEILLVRPDAWLMGSFFWHESLLDFNPKKRDDLRKMVLDYYPKMISSTLFSSEYLSNYTRLYNVGLFAIKKGIKKHYTKDKNVLISCGKGGDVTDQAKYFVEWLARERNTPFDTVYVDPDIISNNPPSWMVPASFTQNMYNKIHVAVIRPGVGTITELLSVGARIFTFFERRNLEMQINSKIITDAGIGREGFDIEDAWMYASSFCIDSSMEENHKKSINKLNFNGALDASLLLGDYDF